MKIDLRRVKWLALILEFLARGKNTKHMKPSSPHAADYHVPAMTWDEFRDYYAASMGGKAVKFPYLLATVENYDEFNEFLNHFATRFPDDYFHLWAVYPRAGLVAASMEVSRISAADSITEMLGDDARSYSADFRLQLESFVSRLREVHREWMEAGSRKVAIEDFAGCSPSIS
jgi:hypothetical protein